MPAATQTLPLPSQTLMALHAVAIHSLDIFSDLFTQHGNNDDTEHQEAESMQRLHESEGQVLSL
jgi:hypothetical protein